MRLALPMVLLLLNPLLLKADDLPRTFFPGILLDEPMPTAFETGQPLSLSGSVEDPGISAIVFTFQRADEAGFAVWVWVMLEHEDVDIGTRARLREIVRDTVRRRAHHIPWVYVRFRGASESI